MAATEVPGGFGRGRGRGRRQDHSGSIGLNILKEASKQRIKPPKGFLEEKGLPIPNNYEKQDLVSETKSKIVSQEGSSDDKTGIKQDLSNKESLGKDEEGQREEKREDQSKAATSASNEEALSYTAAVTVSKTTLNAGAKEFVPSTRAVKDKNSDTNKEEFSLEVYAVALNVLSHRPDKFDDVSKDLLVKISTSLKQLATMNKVVDVLLEKAIIDNNFLYSAVRMISVFLENLHAVVSFRECFYPRLKQLQEEFPNLLNDRENAESQSKALGIALLFADLLCRVEVKENELNSQFVDAVFQIVDQLKEKPTEKMVTTLIKVLKLAGPTLDEYKTKGNGIPKVDDMFSGFSDPNDINSWLAHLDNGEKLCNIIFNIYKLHTRNWDRQPVTVNNSIGQDENQKTLAESVVNQNQVSNSPFKAAAAEFVPSAGAKLPTNEDDQDGFLLGIFRETIDVLIYRPDKFNRVIENLLESVSMFLTQKTTIERILEIIIQQATCNHSFIVMAVRIIVAFLDNLQTDTAETSFKNCFYPRIYTLSQEFETLIKDRDNVASQTKASGIALFFADMLCQIKVAGSLNLALKGAVFQMINTLKENPTELMVYTLVDVLQHIGPTLDSYNKDRSLPEVDELFNSFNHPSKNKAWLSHLENGEKLSNMVFEIYKWHTRNWDRQEDINTEEADDWNAFCGPEDEDPADGYDDSYEQFLKETGQL